MSAFGTSRWGRDARGRTEESSRWLFNNARDAFNQADDQYGRGRYFQDYLLGEYARQYGDGFGTPDQMNSIGREVMPWLDPMLQRRLERVNQMQSNYEGVGPINQTIDSHSSRFDEMGRNIGQNFDALSGDITDWANRAGQREDDYSRSIQDDITGTYGGLTDQNQQNYDGFIRDARNTYDRAIQDVRPGSEAQAATTARAFAPQIASTMLRLRRAGIDPSSPEAASMLREVEGQRARAMDDRLSGAIGDTNALRLARLNTTTDLGREQFGNHQNLQLGRLGDMSNERVRNLNASQGIDRDATGMRMDNRDVHYQRTQDFNRDRAGNDLMYRGMREQDAFNRNNLLDYANNEEMMQHGLQTDRYNAGVDHHGRNVDFRQMALNNMRDTGMNASFNQSNWLNNYATNSMGQAANQDWQMFQHANANGNWLGRFLAGVGMNAAGRIPGVSQVLGTGQQQPNARTPNYNPNARQNYYGNGSYGPGATPVPSYNTQYQPRFRSNSQNPWRN